MQKMDDSTHRWDYMSFDVQSHQPELTIPSEIGCHYENSE